MNHSKGQGELFSGEALNWETNKNKNDLVLSKELLQNWQQRIHKYQSKLFQNDSLTRQQGSLFSEQLFQSAERLNPLSLSPLPISFWRWPDSPHNGPAIYLVMDRPEITNTPLLLYVGETNAANQRWKGKHDCKTYLAAYSEALSSAELRSQLSIRFWTDVPKDTKSRRKIEQLLIRHWLPPFNKETRAHWSTPFTSEIN